MVTLETVVNVKGVGAGDVYAFMLNCSDLDYQKWWPDVHLVFHTVKRYPGDIGNLVYVDEYVGKYRIRGHAVVTSLVPCAEIVWQIKKPVKIPAWFIMRFEDKTDGVEIVHIVSAGFNGPGKIFDPVIRLVLTEEFERQLNLHAQMEFPKLAELLQGRRNSAVTLGTEAT